LCGSACGEAKGLKKLPALHSSKPTKMGTPDHLRHPKMYRPLDIEINCRDLLQPLQPGINFFYFLGQLPFSSLTC
jgi:hypothetical protein